MKLRDWHYVRLNQRQSKLIQESAGSEVRENIGREAERQREESEEIVIIKGARTVVGAK